MGIDPLAFVGTNVVTPIVADKIKDAITPHSDLRSSEELLQDIHILLVETATYLRNSQAVSQDIFKFVQIWKANAGPTFAPFHTGGRQHIAVFSGVSALINVKAPGLGYFNITLPAAAWLTIDFPDNTEYSLDPSFAVPNIVVWERNTNQAIF